MYDNVSCLRFNATTCLFYLIMNLLKSFKSNLKLCIRLYVVLDLQNSMQTLKTEIMNTKEFAFEALLAYSRKKYSKKEVRQILEFIKNYTLEINGINLSQIKYGGTILN